MWIFLEEKPTQQLRIRSTPFLKDEYQASSGKAISCLYVIACVEMQARSRRTIKSASMVRRLSL